MTRDQAERELAAHGPNDLPRPHAPSSPRRLLAQLTSVFAMVLWCASVLSWLADIVELAIAIAVVVVGDLVCLRAGDRVPADCEIIGPPPLLVDMSLVSGESEPVVRGAGDEVVAGSFGWALAVTSPVVLLGVDRADKAARARRRGRRPGRPDDGRRRDLQP